MKNPITYTISKARTVQKKRQIRQILILVAVIFSIISAMVIIRVSMTKDQADALFPSEAETSTAVTSSGTESTIPPESEMTSEGTSEGTSETSDASSSNPSETDATATTGGSETDGTDSSATESENTGPAPIVPEVDVYIPSTTALQTVSHKVRDAAFHTMQKEVQTLLDEQIGVRCGFYYINLKNGEEFGYHESLPFVVGAAIHFPINTVMFDYIREGTLAGTEVMEVTSADKVEGSGMLQDEDNGTQHYIRELSNLSITASDNTATAMLLRRLSGIDEVNDRLKLISNFVDFRTKKTYTDFSGVQHTGMNRSCTFDLAKYAEYFYRQYMAYPSIYQPLFNDLAHTTSDWGVASNLPSDTLVCHKTGTSSTYASETDTAIIFAYEPYVLCVTVECADPVAARALQQQLGDLVYAYLSGCYS